MYNWILKLLGLCRVKFTVERIPHHGKTEVFTATELFPSNATLQQINMRLVDFRAIIFSRKKFKYGDRYNYFWTKL